MANIHSQLQHHDHHAILEEVTQLRRVNRELETILEFSHDGIFVTDGQGVVRWVNNASARICGRSRSDLVGRNVEELEKNGIFSPSVTLMVLRGRRQVTLFQDTGSGRKVLVTGTPVLDENGEITQVVNNSRDITELLNLREQLEQAEIKANQYKLELEALKTRYASVIENVIAESEPMRRLVSLSLRVAAKDVPVLILGESGVGKNALAKIIHRASVRSSGPFIEINCGAIPETLFESELFGYESGAFTGARRGGKLGMIELAHRGTLFLNEVGELPLAMQVKLLTVLQEGEFTRVGGGQPVHVDVRVVAATNRDLEKMVESGSFREDLFYRLNVVSLTIPPLRERPEDMKAQAYYYLTQCNEKYGANKRLTGQALRALLSYPWPGNTRQLRNAIERAVVISEGDELQPADLNLKEGADDITIPPMKKAMEQFEKELLERTFKLYGSTYKVAAALGMSQPTVVRRAKKYNIANIPYV